MKVFIADDELYIIELLIKLIEWDELGLQLCGTATNGDEALEKIKSQHADILITDIRMPGCDGLSLVNMIREFNPNCAFIIISGHKQFDYALNAIKNNVEDYLLKPIKKDEINDLLSKIITRINEDNSSKNMLNHFSVQVRSRFINSLVNHNLAIKDDINKINKDNSISFQKGMFRVYILRIDHEDIFKTLTNSLYEKVVSQIKNLLQLYCYEVLFHVQRFQITFLCNYDKDTDLDRVYDDIISQTTDTLYKFFSPGITLAAGYTVDDISLLPKSMSSAESAIRNRIFSSTSKIICANDLVSIESLPEAIFPESEKWHLAREIECFNIDGFIDRVKSLFNECRSVSPANADIYWLLCHELLTIFWETVQRIGIHEIPAITRKQLNIELSKATSVSALQECLLSCTVMQFNKYFNINETNINASIRIAKKYISEHYADKLSLKDMGNFVHLNPVYFSVLFKKETGVNYSDYINEFRIEIAKTKLKNIANSITDVAQSIGIADQRYFSKLFKKLVGITPTQYRKIHADKSLNAIDDEET